MVGKSSRHPWTEHEWRDEVAGKDEELGRFEQDLDAFVHDLKDMARMVVEVTIEPLKAFAESFPRAMAHDANHVHGAWPGTRDRWRSRRP